MARPRKNPEEKKNKRLTVYFTEAEAEQLNLLSDMLEMDKTKIIGKALKQYIRTIENPPEQLKKAINEKVQNLVQEQVEGYVCDRGDIFFLEWAWPSPPLNCPCCGSKGIRRLWTGIVRKGFS